MNKINISLIGSLCLGLLLLLLPGCDGSSSPSGDGTAVHASLAWSDYPSDCVSCHIDEYRQMADAMHYRWTGDTTEMANANGTLQGKVPGAVNSYCINILGDWKICGTCHVGRGLSPDAPLAGIENIDCLVCHNVDYAYDRTRLADGSMGPSSNDQTVLDGYVRNLAKPTRTICLKCHANAGGGDAVKRGDLSMATISNNDPNFDVHMNTSGADLQCQRCHIFDDHKTLGRGSDLRPTDDISRGSEIKCTSCHTDKDTPAGHTSKISEHVDMLACQVCHIPTFAKVATEVHRDWTLHHDGSIADGVSGPGHPFTQKAADLIPAYKWWNRMSDNYLLGDDASLTYDVGKGTYPTSRPVGEIFDGLSKIYPFKYKTSYQPMVSADNAILALDTLIYIGITGDVDEAIESGLVNMGYQIGEPVEWITTDTYQLINHGVEPEENALFCSDCHDGTGETINGRIPFAELGYHTWPLEVSSCTLCHTNRLTDWESMHLKHADEIGLNCYDCHSTEPTGFIENPIIDGLCNNCHIGRIYNDAQELHKVHAGGTITCADCHTF